MCETIVMVENLKIHFTMKTGVVKAVNGVSFDLRAGETLGVIGESGSGKSVIARALLGMVDRPGRVEGRIIYKGLDLLSLSRKEKQNLRGREIAMVFQDPMTSLNPILTVGKQLTEVIRRHTPISRRQARERAMQVMSSVGLIRPAELMGAFPFQLSGGMRQRVMLAMALGANPSLLIADEPTTALDVTVQAQILKELHRLQQEKGMALLVITHNWGVVAELADRVAVMYAGRLVEWGSVADIYSCPAHPYTRSLLNALPRLGQRKHRPVPGPFSGLPLAFPGPDAGCSFAPRCAYKGDYCRRLPRAAEVSPGHLVLCHAAGMLTGYAASAEGRRELA